MQIEIKESHEGEFDLPDDELMSKIEEGLLTALRRVIKLGASPSPDSLLFPPTQQSGQVEGEPLSKKENS